MRATYLENEFNNLFVDNFPDVTTYFQKLKDLKDQLSKIGQFVSGKTLILRLCAGLIEFDYDGLAQQICQTKPLAPFEELIPLSGLA